MTESDLEANITKDLPGTESYEDPSSKIWSVYVAEANIFDKALVESWKGDMDGILFFAGLFSASVTAFIIESYKMLTPNSGDLTVSLLMQISHQLNTSSSSSSLSTNTALFSGNFTPTPSAVRVNVFWFLSLSFGLACALAATLVEQWARNYIQCIDRRPAPHKKARVRAFLYEGVKSFGMNKVVEGIPILLHIAVFLFFVGLVEFLFPIHFGIACLMLLITIICGGLYCAITILPAVRLSCPYRTPLSGIFRSIFRVFGFLRYFDSGGQEKRISGNIAQGQELHATKCSTSGFQRDFRALKWTVEVLTEDNDFETFIEGLRIYLSDGTSPAIRDLMLDKDVQLTHRITRLLVSCRFGTLPADVKRRRALTAMGTLMALVKVLEDFEWSKKWTSLAFFDPLMGHSLRQLSTDEDPSISSNAKLTIACIADKLQRDVGTITRRRDLWDLNGRPSTLIWSSTDSALNTLNSLGRLDGVVEMIPDLMVSIPSPYTITDQAVLLCIALGCGLSHITTLLRSCMQPGPESSERRIRAISCMRAISHVAAVFQAWNTSTIKSLAALKKGNNLNIAPYVTFTASRAVCHLQCDIVDTISRNGSDERLPASRAARLYGAMHALGLLDRLSNEDHELWQDLHEHLRLGLVSDLPELHEEQRWQEVLYGLFQKGESYLKQLPHDDQKVLDTFELRTSAFKINPAYPVPLHLKLIVNRGHVAVLVRLLQAFVNLPLLTSAGEVQFALETLHFVNSNLSARFCSALIQRRLVQLIGDVISTVYVPGHLNLAQDMAWDSIRTLFAVLITLGDPVAIADARQVLTGYLSLPKLGALANGVLCQLGGAGAQAIAQE